ncbi:Cyclin_N domain-containing protein [Naegleria gruberi]|uniref:Cyclin_N domain-containing protein n=1 Tax=Naegleria gruberi TaxID=5762 RepID=D2VZL3_NAEGR|nr:Cyclin_N domain-containing protein [Naegleria gruberi]EFC37720.1 Cyclin_N domain-containing protein [Naegleria gruberi]|eukprot:XP_002670464.1 Cyclin_N domain-containing protein [Naegleria gruberi strain NEG-M]
MKGWRQKVSNNLKRKTNSLTTSYSSQSDSVETLQSKITKKTRVSSTFDSIRIHALAHKVNEKQEEITWECEEDVSTTALNTIQPTPFQSREVKQELVNGHSYISPSLNETETAEPISTLAQDEITCSWSATSFSIHPEKESQQYETMEDSVEEIILSQDHDSNSNQEECANQDVDSMQEDDEEEADEEEAVEVSDSFQLLSDNISRETINCAKANYLSTHPHVKPQYRRTVIDWFNILQTELDIPKEILYHATMIFDRSLDRFNIEQYYLIDVDNLQALGCACFFISTKYYGRSVNLSDILPPVSSDSSIEDLKKQVLRMESWVLNTLDFELRSILLIDYVALFIHAMKNDQNFTQAFPSLVEADNFVNFMEKVSNYLCEIQLHNYDMLWFRPSLVALSCFVLAFQMLAPHSNFKSVSIIRKFLKIYFEEMSRIERNNVEDHETQGQSSLVIEIEEFNNCMKRCLVSMQSFEQLSLKNHNRNREHFRTITKYYPAIAPFISQPEQLIELSIQDLLQWTN